MRSSRASLLAPEFIVFDAHCHIDFDELAKDRELVIERARDAGLHGLIIAGVDASSRALAKALAERPGIWAAAGLHPWRVAAAVNGEREGRLWLERELEALDEALGSRGFIAVGECGLDFFRATSALARELQRAAFHAQLDLAVTHRLPAVVHAVRCHDEMLSMLRRRKDNPPIQLHGYSGPAGLVARFAELGCVFSFGAPLTWEGHQKTKRALARAHELPGAWMFETDAPDRPVTSRGRDGRGEPSDLVEITAAAATLLGRDAVVLASEAEENARAFFGLASRRL